MATYTGAQLSGEGIDNPTLTAGVQYTFVMAIPTNLSGSGYFTMETITDAMELIVVNQLTQLVLMLT